MSFPRYSGYKDSEVKWLGEVPEHWDIRRVRRIFVIKKHIAGELGFDILSITQQGIKVRDPESNDGQVSMDYSKYQVVEPGDFAMNHMDLLTGYVDISRRPGVTSPDYRVFSIAEHCISDPGYLLYVFQMGYRQKILYAYGQGSSQLGRWRLPTEEFKDWAVPFPSLNEQAAIATFLDRETAKIDALIAEQQRLIELLQEKRQAVISHAVTKGLNPNAPMKDSGVEWLGEVPKHWDMRKTSQLFNGIGSGTTPKSDATEYYEDGAIPWVVTGDLNDSVLDACQNRITEKAMAEHTTLRFYPAGSVAIAMYGATTGKASVLDFEATVNQACCVLPPSSLVLSKYLLGFILAARKHLLSVATGGGQPNINQEVIRSLRMPLPSLEEQVKIMGHLESVVSGIDSLLDLSNKQVLLLQERRSALISAAVTGQIDVRGLATEEEVA